MFEPFGVWQGGGMTYLNEVDKPYFYMYDNQINRTHIHYQTGVVFFAIASFLPSIFNFLLVVFCKII